MNQMEFESTRFPQNFFPHPIPFHRRRQMFDRVSIVEALSLASTKCWEGYQAGPPHHITSLPEKRAVQIFGELGIELSIGCSVCTVQSEHE